MPSLSAGTDSRLTAVRDRDYLLDRYGVIFKVIGDVHPDSHYLGYVKYYPDTKGDRRLFGQTYRQNSVVSKSFGILADRPECYVYSDVLGCVITGLPRGDIAAHYRCRQALTEIHEDPDRVQGTRIGGDLLAIIDHIMHNGNANHFGVTGSFLVGCVIKQESRKLQGLTPHAKAHVNCEPLRPDDDHTFAAMQAKEIGNMTLLATVTDHTRGLTTPAIYQIDVQNILSSTIEEPGAFTRRITYLRSYLGAYTGAFRTGDNVYIAGKLVHLQDGDNSVFGIELSPWNVGSSYIASLAA